MKTDCLMLAAAALATGLAVAAPVGDGASLDRSVTEYRVQLDRQGRWVNRYMAHGTGEYLAPSADVILAATLRVYTHEVLERNGWVNPWVASPGYDTPNLLVRVAQGDGVTQRVRG